MSQQLRSARGGRRADRLRASCRRPFSNTLSSMDFTPRRLRAIARDPRRQNPRQAGCMAKSDQRRKPKEARLPADLERAVAAAEDKKAADMVVLDLRKAAGFTD